MKMRYIESSCTHPGYNLALEEYVFENLPRDQGYFMLWQNDNAIIVGKHQNTSEEINAEYVREKGIRVVRRLSGGGAVYHDMGNINFTFIVDADQMEELDLHLFCNPVVNTLAKLGIQAEISGRNDITIDGQKFSGNSQYLKQGRIMHHGTIMFDSDFSVLTQALQVSQDKYQSKGFKSVRSRVTNVRQHLSTPISFQEFKELLKRYMVQEQQLEEYVLTEEDDRKVQALQKERYDTWEWNYGASPKHSVYKVRRVEGCGKIELFMDIDKGGLITAFSTRGDYFGSGSEQLEPIVHGLRAEKEVLLHALKDIPLSQHYKGLRLEDLVDIIAQ